MASIKNTVTEAAKAGDYKKRISELENLVARLSRELEGLHASKFVLPAGKPRKATGGSFCRVIVPDSHGCYIDAGACKAFLADLAQIDPAEIVMLGDHLDCSGFLAQHMTANYVAEAAYTFADDVAAANQFLDAVQERSPKANVHYLEGNHERRIEKWVVTQTLRHAKDAEYLRGLFSAPIILHAKKRGLRWYNQGEFYHELAIPATIRLGACHFTHGEYTCQNAAKSHLAKFGANVVHGHTHRIDSYAIRTVAEGSIQAWSPGCLCKLQRLWNHTNLTNWGHGYGLQVVQSSGRFLHINIPIVDGRSLLAPLAKTLGSTS